MPMAELAVASPSNIKAGRAAAIVLAMLVAIVGIDLLFNAGLLARYYYHPGPVLLSTKLLFRRIPLGYASMLISASFFLWLQSRIGATTIQKGAQLGALWGAVTGTAGGMAMFSFLPLGADFLSGVAVLQVVSYSAAGAIGGAGLGGAKVWKLYTAAATALIVGVGTAMLLQAIGVAPVEHQ
jgi:hypothetical protein